MGYTKGAYGCTYAVVSRDFWSDTMLCIFCSNERPPSLEHVFPLAIGGVSTAGHKIYPYLLRGLKIERPNHVWCADITYIPIGRGFLHLVAIMDWASRAVLPRRLSKTMDASFCAGALEEALVKYGKPEIFNTGQGSQFTGGDFTGVLLEAGIRISMDGRGRWMDNVFIERLWRSLKYEDIYLKHFMPTGAKPRPAFLRGALTTRSAFIGRWEPDADGGLARWRRRSG